MIREVQFSGVPERRELTAYVLCLTLHRCLPNGMIRKGNVISPAASERMCRNLIRIYFDWEALSQIPPFMQVASKSGAVDAARSEVVLVNAPHGDYVFCIATKNQKDISWNQQNEGYRLIRNVSALLWSYFEPGSKWKPAAGVEKYAE